MRNTSRPPSNRPSPQHHSNQSINTPLNKSGLLQPRIRQEARKQNSFFRTLNYIDLNYPYAQFHQLNSGHTSPQISFLPITTSPRLATEQSRNISQRTFTKKLPNLSGHLRITTQIPQQNQASIPVTYNLYLIRRTHPSQGSSPSGMISN
jgi:S-adenosylmethionine synthetase